MPACRACWASSSPTRATSSSARGRRDSPGATWKAGGDALFEFEGGSIYNADLSWDDRWLAVATVRPDGATALQVVPWPSASRRRRTRIPIPESHGLRSGPRWSPEGDRIYYLAKRDGFHCVWAQMRDSKTKKPRGEPAAVFPAHRNPWLMSSPPWAFSLSVDRRQVVFNTASITGSVLFGQLPPD